MTSAADDRRKRNDARVAADVAKYGCHVVSVFDPDGDEPMFSYSIGIFARCGAPEALVIGLHPELGGALVNHYNDQVRRGTRFERGVAHSGFLEGFDLYIEPAKPVLAAAYTLGCARYYRGAAFPVVQLIYPTTRGAWPWQRAASDAFRASQPMLGRKRPDRR